MTVACQATLPSLEEWALCRLLCFKLVRLSPWSHRVSVSFHVFDSREHEVYAMSAMFGYYLRRVDQRYDRISHASSNARLATGGGINLRSWQGLLAPGVKKRRICVAVTRCHSMPDSGCEMSQASEEASNPFSQASQLF